MKSMSRSGIIFPHQMPYSVCELCLLSNATKSHLTVFSFSFSGKGPHIPISAYMQISGINIEI